MTVRLHCFGESGNAYKAALALEMSGVDWEPVFVDFFGGQARTPEWRAENPMGEAPVLVDGDFRLSQSGAIQAWITDRTGRFGGEGDGRYEVLRWVLWDNHKLSSPAGMVRFLANFLPEAKRPAEVIAFHQARLRAAYAVARRPPRRAATGSSAPTSPTRTCRAAATSTIPSRSASTAPSGPPSTPGSTGSPRCRDGATPTT